MPLFRAAAIAALILANTFFRCAAIYPGFPAANTVQQLIEERRGSARIVADLQANLDELLPAVQLGVTLTSLTLGWLGEPFVARFLLPWLSMLRHARFYGGILSTFLAFGLITYLEVIFGELVPESPGSAPGRKNGIGDRRPDVFLCR